jgi:hypothetical protein
MRAHSFPVTAIRIGIKRFPAILHRMRAAPRRPAGCGRLALKWAARPLRGSLRVVGHGVPRVDHPVISASAHTHVHLHHTQVLTVARLRDGATRAEQGVKVASPTRLVRHPASVMNTASSASSAISRNAASRVSSPSAGMALFAGPQPAAASDARQSLPPLPAPAMTTRADGRTVRRVPSSMRSGSARPTRNALVQLVRAATPPDMPHAPVSAPRRFGNTRTELRGLTSRSVVWNDTPARIETTRARRANETAKLAFRAQDAIPRVSTRGKDSSASRSQASAVALNWRAAEAPISVAAAAAFDTPARPGTAIAATAPEGGQPSKTPVPLPALASMIAIDPSAIERLSDDVMRRIERKFRIERQRRGL